ncbi:MAG: nuclear transport factor 2 family protein, partial [Anaeromyxobacteraceae bacterium]
LFRRLDATRAGDPAAALALAADDYRDGPTDRAALEARLRSEAGTPRPDLKARAWQIRVDRDGAEVGEDLEDASGGRPVRTRYRLERRGERWVFVSGM